MIGTNSRVPGFNTQFILTNDAYKVGVTAILTQVQNGVERSISYASWKVDKVKRNYVASRADM